MPWEQYRRQMGVVIEKDKESKGATAISFGAALAGRGGPAAPEMHRE